MRLDKKSKYGSLEGQLSLFSEEVMDSLIDNNQVSPIDLYLTDSLREKLIFRVGESYLETLDNFYERTPLSHTDFNSFVKNNPIHNLASSAAKPLITSISQYHKKQPEDLTVLDAIIMSKSISEYFPRALNPTQRMLFTNLNSLLKFDFAQQELLHSYVLDVLNVRGNYFQ